MSTAPPPPPSITTAQLEQLKRVREGSLLRKWTAGEKLRPEELAEIAHVLPSGVLVQQPLPRVTYRHDYLHYAAAIGYDVRNIKRLVGLGKKARLPMPLDEPARLDAWWEQMRQLGHLKQQVPARIADHAAKHRAPQPAGSIHVNTAPAGSASAAPGAAAPGLPPPAAGASPKVNFNELEAVGLEAGVRELTLQLAATRDLLREAREKGLDEVVITRRQKAFDSTLDSLRKTEAAWQDLQVRRGDLAPVADFRKDLTTLATTLRGMMRRRADNVCAALASVLSSEHLGLVRAAIIAEGERERQLLHSARHWSPSDVSAGN